MSDFQRDCLFIALAIVTPLIALVVDLLIKNHDLRKTIEQMREKRFMD